jgi:Uma2 family endonuclease
MIELLMGRRTIDLETMRRPFKLRVFGVTEEKFDQLVDEDIRAELIDGVMVVHSPASPRHDNVAEFLRSLLRCYADEKELGLVLGPDSLIHLATCRRFAPDLYFLRRERVPRPLPEDQFEGVPDLVVEVLSPSNEREGLNDKRPAYREAGVPEVWFVDADAQQVLVDRRRRKRYATQVVTDGPVTSSAVSGFWGDATWLWADRLPRVTACLRQIQQ